MIEMDTINIKATTKILAKVNNPTKEIKWNFKCLINSKEGRKRRKGEQRRWNK